ARARPDARMVGSEPDARAAGPQVTPVPRSIPAGREAFPLPLALLTVAGAGGMRLRPDGAVRFDPPPLMALLLGTLLVGLLVRARAVDAVRLFSPARRPLENASGAVILVALVAATSQVFHLLTPAS